MIYVIKSGDAIKFGYAQNLKKRLQSYATNNPNLEVLAEYEGGSQELERNLHRNFKATPIHKKEWYQYYDGVLEDIDKLIDLCLKDIYTYHVKIEDICEINGCFFHTLNLDDSQVSFLAVQKITDNYKFELVNSRCIIVPLSNRFNIGMYRDRQSAIDGLEDTHVCMLFHPRAKIEKEAIRKRSALRL